MAQNRDDFEALDKETLEALSIVCFPGTNNPRAQALYDNAQQRILRRLAQIQKEESRALDVASRQKSHDESADKSGKKTAAKKFAVGILSGVAVALIVALCKMLWPQLFR